MTPVFPARNAGLLRSGMSVVGAGLLVLVFAAGCQSKKSGEIASGLPPKSDVSEVSSTVAQLPVEPSTRTETASKIESPMKTEPTAPAPECATVTFRHRSTSKHALGEECVLHGNRIELPFALRDPRFTSFCVRVDGTAVRAVRRKNGFDLAAISKPTSVITVRGCPSDKACAQDCTPARDAFMDGLIGEAGEAGGAGWKGEADAVAALDPAVKRELAALDDDAVSDAWDSGAEAPAVSACGKAKADRR